MILTITNWNRNSSVAQLWFHVTTTLLSKPSLNHLDVRWQTHAVASWARGLCGGCKISIHDAVVLPTVATASRRALGHYCCVILGWSTTIHVSDFDSELQTEDNRWSFYFYSIYEELHSWWFHSIQISQMTLVQFYLCRNKSQQQVPQSASKTQINRQKQSARVFVSLSKQIISVMDVDVLPCRVCDSASAPQFDWTSGPRTVTNELPRLVSATFSGATWLNWTEERQPMKPLEAPCITSSSKFSIPTKTQPRSEKCFWLRSVKAEWEGLIAETYWWLCLTSAIVWGSAPRQMTVCTFCGCPGWSGWIERNQITRWLHEIQSKVTAAAAQRKSELCVHCSLTWKQLQVALKWVWPCTSVPSCWLGIIA